MASIRQEKVAELIKRDLSSLFQRQSSAWFGGLFITVTQVRMAPDLGLAKVYLSFMAVQDKKAALEAVRSEGWRVRKALAANALLCPSQPVVARDGARGRGRHGLVRAGLANKAD